MQEYNSNNAHYVVVTGIILKDGEYLIKEKNGKMEIYCR